MQGSNGGQVEGHVSVGDANRGVRRSRKKNITRNLKENP